MITLTTAITIANDIPRIVKWKVSDAHDYVDQTPPCMILNLVLYGPGSVAFDVYNLLIFDSIPSTILVINPAPAEIRDQFQYASSQLAGTAYTTLSGLWNGPTTPANHSGRLKAVEGALIAGGVLPTAFAGT
jgi:hypothetical protein